MLTSLTQSVPTWVWTALIAVVTSVAATVVVEFAAKPRLEARKARLLHNRSQLDEVVFGLQTLALQIGSLPNVPNGSSQELFEVYTTQVRKVETAADAALKPLGRLSHRYTQRHARHLKRTAFFLAYVEATAVATLRGDSGADARLRRAATLIEHFDTYFLIYLGLEDSAEPWAKRLFWRMMTRRGYETRSEAVAVELGAAPTAESGS